MQEVEMTKEEQIKMYMKSSKEELCIMLIEANKHLKKRLTLTSVGVTLPDFLYEDKGIIYTGVHGTEDVTEEWEEWLKNR